MTTQHNETTFYLPRDRERESFAPNCQEKRVFQLYTCQNMTQLTSFIFAALRTTWRLFTRTASVVWAIHWTIRGRWCVIEYYSDDLYGTILHGKNVREWVSFEGFSVAQRNSENIRFSIKLRIWNLFTNSNLSQLGKAFFFQKTNQHKGEQIYLYSFQAKKINAIIDTT